VSSNAEKINGEKTNSPLNIRFINNNRHTIIQNIATTHHRVDVETNAHENKKVTQSSTPTIIIGHHNKKTTESSQYHPFENEIINDNDLVVVQQSEHPQKHTAPLNSSQGFAEKNVSQPQKSGTKKCDLLWRILSG